MGKATYQEFVEFCPSARSSKIKWRSHMRNLFDRLNEDKSLIRMVLASDVGKPALGEVMTEIRQWRNENDVGELGVTDRQIIGAMVTVCLAPFGLSPSIRRKFRL